MTAIEISLRDWLQQGALLASQYNDSRGNSAANCESAAAQTVDLRRYDPGRLGYALTRCPASQFERTRTSGGSPPFLQRDVLRSSGSIFFSTAAEASGLPHAEAKLAFFKNKYRELSVARAYPERCEIRATPIQERVKTALKGIVKAEELKRSGQLDEDGELVQVRAVDRGTATRHVILVCH
jgi:hypothetical protein